MRQNPLETREQRDARERDELQRRLANEQEATDYQWLMTDPRGRRLMRAWMAFCGIDHTPFTGDSKTFFRCGAQNVALMLKDKVTQHALEGYFQMLREHVDESSAHSGGGRR